MGRETSLGRDYASRSANALIILHLLRLPLGTLRRFAFSNAPGYLHFFISTVLRLVIGDIGGHWNLAPVFVLVIFLKLAILFDWTPLVLREINSLKSVLM